MVLHPTQTELNLSSTLLKRMLKTSKYKFRHLCSMYSQQLPVEDSNDSRTLQAVGGGAALTFLEGCWQLHDLIPFTDVLQRKHIISQTEKKYCRSEYMVIKKQ